MHLWKNTTKKTIAIEVTYLWSYDCTMKGKTFKQISWPSYTYGTERAGHSIFERLYLYHL